MASTEVLVPDVELVVHIKDPIGQFPVSKTILPGDYVLLDDIAEYQQRAARAGKIKKCRVMEKADADAMFERIRGLYDEEDTSDRVVIDLGANPEAI